MKARTTAELLAENKQLKATIKKMAADYEALRLAGNYFVDYVTGGIPGIESSPDNLFPKRANGHR